ncbi:MAG: hypothetical protein HQK89_11210 [Nitrospirae bacterium]|nr:hypothetical protein [Nitrospirota bacterium]
MFRLVLLRIAPLTAIALLSMALTKSGDYPLSVAVGGILGLLNHEGLKWGVKRLLSVTRTGIVIVILNMLRISAFFMVSIVLLYYKVVNFRGFVIGITVVYLIVLTEGWVCSRHGQR